MWSFCLFGNGPEFELCWRRYFSQCVLVVEIIVACEIILKPRHYCARLQPARVELPDMCTVGTLVMLEIRFDQLYNFDMAVISNESGYIHRPQRNFERFKTVRQIIDAPASIQSWRKVRTGTVPVWVTLLGGQDGHVWSTVWSFGRGGFKNWHREACIDMEGQIWRTVTSLEFSILLVVRLVHRSLDCDLSEW